MTTTKYASMLKKLMSVSLLLVAATVSLPAHAITNYTINFSVASGSPAPISGSFDYDSTTPSFSNFQVTWDGFTIDLTASANAPFVGATGCTGEASTPTFGFAIMSQSLLGCTPSYTWSGLAAAGVTPGINFFAAPPSVPLTFSDSIGASVGSAADWTFASASGTWSITPAPEPSSLLLLGTGLLGLVGLMSRKRLA